MLSPNDAIERFLDALSVEEGSPQTTLASYRNDLRVFAAWLEAREINDFGRVTTDQLGAYLQHLVTTSQQRKPEQGYAELSVRRMITAVRSLFRYLARDELLATNPAEHLASGKVWRSLPGVLSVAQVEELLAAPVGESPMALRDRALLEALYATGGRVSEVLGWERSAIHAERGFVRVVGKGGKERLVPIGERALEALQLYLEAGRPTLDRRGSKLVFLSKSGKALGRDRVWQIVQKYAQGAGIPSDLAHPHTLRHCFATHLLENGAEIRSVQEMLGHADISTTQIYTHVEGSRLASVVQRCHLRGRRSA